MFVTVFDAKIGRHFRHPPPKIVPLPNPSNSSRLEHTQPSSITISLQANEVASSSHMELEAVRRGLEQLADLNIALESFTTDRHPSVRKYMRTTHPEVKHQFDVWHVSKGTICENFIWI